MFKVSSELDFSGFSSRFEFSPLDELKAIIKEKGVENAILDEVRAFLWRSYRRAIIPRPENLVDRDCFSYYVPSKDTSRAVLFHFPLHASAKLSRL